MSALDSPQQFAARFALPAPPSAVQLYPGGHINDSYLVDCASTSDRFLMQRINGDVFPEPSKIMQNIARVSEHVYAKLGAEQPFLQLVPTHDGAPYLQDEDGDIWRVYAFIEGATMHEAAASPHEAAEAGRAVGEFQLLLNDLPGPRLHEIIPNFHHTPTRFARLHEMVGKDPHSRLADCQPAVDFAFSCEPLAHRIVDGISTGELPEQAVHNDAKMSNVLLDAASGHALCVVDLDTVMPGSTLYDFGDMMRTMLCSAAEDERDLARVRVDLDMFAALAEGYLGAARPILNEAELSLLVHSGMLISLETGVRFLSDHLNGDRYFRVHRTGQNLDRARAQFALVRSMQEQRAALEGIVQQLLQRV
jgi:Ser/Thr protein kinase RdoA (MazF antagonist)